MGTSPHLSYQLENHQPGNLTQVVQRKLVSPPGDKVTCLPRVSPPAKVSPPSRHSLLNSPGGVQQVPAIQLAKAKEDESNNDRKDVEDTEYNSGDKQEYLFLPQSDPKFVR